MLKSRCERILTKGVHPMKQKGTKGFVIGIIIFMAALLGYYVYLNNKTKDQQEVTSQTEEEKLLNYDFEENYPKTVRETVKLHCRYLKSAYNGKFTDEELETVNSQIRNLFDEELLENNPEAQELQGLKDDIELYQEKKQKFVNYTLEEASQIQYNTEDDKKYAKTTVTLTLSVGSTMVSVEQQYLLRQDEEGRWKILGWQTEQTDSTENEGDTE
jgi:LPS O-antigen subunit length determinant protein (WzzB/FepE family)